MIIPDSESSGSRTSTESAKSGGLQILEGTDRTSVSKKDKFANAGGNIPRSIELPPIHSLNLLLIDGTENLPHNLPNYVEIDQFNLSSAETRPKLQKESSIGKASVPIWSILPLYHMYTSTISKSLDLNDDDDDHNVSGPPAYDDISTLSSANSFPIVNNNSSTSRHGSTPTVTHRNSLSSEANFIVADESGGQWQNTILDNVHQLRNLSDCDDNESAKNLKMEMFFTEDVGNLGVAPNFIDILKNEYKQGDLINGYVMIENLSDKPVPFDMFYVLFEGTYTVSTNTGLGASSEPKTVSKKFLEMFDFSASWHYGHINRLVTEYSNPYTCPDLIDPLDNTRMSISDRLLHPKTRYKRFFTFQIPESLLDSTCEHDLSTHTKLPPTIGIPRCELPNTKTSKYLKMKEKSKVKDFAFIDTNICFSVEARFIGKASMYGEIKPDSQKSSNSRIINSTGDEFLILKDTHHVVRIVQENETITMDERLEKYRYDKIFLDNLVSRVDERLAHAEELREIVSGPQIANTNILGSITSNASSTLLDTIMSPTSISSNLGSSGSSEALHTMSPSSSVSRKISDELIKCRQLYKPRGSNSTKRIAKDGTVYEDLGCYKAFFPFQKKSITGVSKFLGTLVLSTPRAPHIVKYIQPLQFRESEVDLDELKVDIPINLEYVLLESNPDMRNKLPEIKKIAVELVAHTIKSDDFPLPFEINHDMLFENNKLHNKTYKLAYEYKTDYFEESIVKPMRKKVLKLKSLAKELGPEVFRMEARLAADIKSICNIKSKSIIMSIDDVTDSSGGPIDQFYKNSWQIEEKLKNVTPATFNKQVNIRVDLSKARMKIADLQKGPSFDNFCLVPSFQMCHMARIYYMKIMVTLLKGEVLPIHIPIEIVK